MLARKEKERFAQANRPSENFWRDMILTIFYTSAIVGASFYFIR